MGPVYITRNTVFAATTGMKTVLRLVQTTQFLVKIHEIALFLDGVTASAVPATWELNTSDETTSGTGTGSAVTTQIAGKTQAHGLTVTQNHSAEPTVVGTAIKSGFVPQYMGTLILPNPLGLEEQLLSDLADATLLRINVTANVNVFAWIKWSRG